MANRLHLASLPTALEAAGQLGAAIGVPALMTKRDDVAGLVYGGNKVRKLEYLLGDALRRGCDAVVTFGAAGSNHALATAIYAKQAGLACYAVLTDQVQTPWVGNTLRWHALLGTHLEHAPGYVETQAEATRLRAMHPAGPDRLYEVPWGGSSALGCLGFVDAAAELSTQLAAAAVNGKVRVYLPWSFRFDADVPAGWYRVALAGPPALDTGSLSAFPAKLARPDQSGQLREVVAGKSHVFEFAVDVPTP